ncbi:capsid protein, partial [Streptococcus suis]
PHLYQMSGTAEKAIGITDLPTPIRADYYIQANNEGLSLLEMQVGVSTGMINIECTTNKNSTEILKENT